MIEEKQSNDTTNNQKDSYSIYEYLKKNTSFLIAVVSALVAIVTMLLRLASHLYHVSYLNYWNIDSKIVSTPETYLLEDIALSFALLVCGIIYMGIMNEISSTFRKHIYYIKIIKEIIKNNDYRFNKCKTRTKKRQNKQKSKKDEIKGWDIKLNSNEYNDLKKSYKSLKLNAFLQLIVHFFLLEIFWGAVMYIVLLNQGVAHNNSLMLFFVLVYGLLMLITGYFFATVDKEKIEEECIRNSKKSRDNNFELPMFPIRKINQLGISYFLSNKHIFCLLIFIFVIFFCFSIAEYEQGEQDAQNLKNHISVIAIDDSYYAIITRDSNHFIAEKIEINDKNAIVYVNEQIIIPKENIEMKVYTFENVTRDNT